MMKNRTASIALAFILGIPWAAPVGLAVVTLAGCASAGNTQLKDADRSKIDQQIVQGKTTKEEVRAALEDPTGVSFTNDGREVWTYLYAHATPTAQSYIPVVNLFSHGANVDRKRLVILFDDKGIVEKYSYSEGKSQTRGGIAQ